MLYWCWQKSKRCITGWTICFAPGCTNHWCGNLNRICVFAFESFYLYLCICFTVWAICNHYTTTLKMLQFDVLRLYIMWFDGFWYNIDVGASQVWQFVLHQVATNDGGRSMKAFISQRTLCVHHSFIIILISSTFIVILISWTVWPIFYKCYLIYLFRTHRCLPGQSFL